MGRKTNIAVLMGGRTAEHEVSLATGRVVVNSLDKRKYNVKPVTITKSGTWLVPRGYLTGSTGPKKVQGTPGLQLMELQKRSPQPVPTGLALERALEEKVDIVFIALHGPFGEDGTVQGLLEIAGIPYTGSGVLASALAMNKIKSREIFAYHGLAVPRWLVYDEWTWQERPRRVAEEIESTLGFPCVVKPPGLGSSVGTSMPASRRELKAGMERAFEYDTQVLVEEYLQGDEVTCAVLGNEAGKDPIALPPTQIVPKTSQYFDYEAKYTPGATEEITPARISERLIAEVQKTAVTVHQLLGCEGMSRADTIVAGEKVYVLETNTIPGMTEISLYPMAARAMGMTFPALLDRIIELAFERVRHTKSKVEH
ncbi:hypothetical protein AMJ39_03115 [candidate division TA06 bacterium DG_24]|uniref:D-alanine--D-alanine ligase n=1 Tax=candidate division TA06 bacterium DG_24 TaxID=1703770 RepID=A0A0S7WUD1_UNCT6|nr:MAG: hypothetical protein AMJ39_03115 [candidate division TA06 bacterium DG_24]